MLQKVAHVKLIYKNLHLIYVQGNNLKGRENMQKAAFYAGRAFTRGPPPAKEALFNSIRV